MSTATGARGEPRDPMPTAPSRGAAGVETPGASEDSRARRAVVEDLERTLFVEAGAGTGKTTALVGRIVELVRAGMALADIAAITFTEKAAAELRERLRQDLLARTRRADPGEADILGRALEDLDGAAVCTLHSFAQRILREHTTEAGLPPRPEMLDEIGADMEFADAWDRFVEEVLIERRMERALVMADALGMRMATLRAVARRMVDNWDLAAERVPELGTVDEVPLLEFADLGAPMRSLADESRWHDVPLDQLSSSQPVEPDDLYRVLVDLGRLADRLEGAAELEALALLEEVAAGRVPRGRKANWRRGFDKEAVRERLRELREEAGRRLDFVGRACADRLLARLAEFTLVEADRRRRQGRLIFHDLLVLARNLLRHAAVGEEVRRSLRDRYRRLLIDEFQDTDPIQVELALLIVGEPSDAGDGGGRLFFVGDPKQSLYRFRRADIGTYLQVADRVGPAARETLSRNWRSSPEIVDWVNAVFGRLIRPAAGSQPAYVPLVAGRERPDGSAGSPVVLLGADITGGGEPGEFTAASLREREFGAVAALARRAVRESWPVCDGAETRPLRLRDVCVLIPARTALGALIDAFETAGVPYRVESSSLVYGTRAETDLLSVLRALDDPADHLAVVTALRSAAFGFGDDELYTYRRLCAAGHRPWDYLSPQPEHPVTGALGWLAEKHAERLWCSPGEIVDKVVRERGLMELAFAEDRHRDTWRRLRRAVDQARAFSDSTGGTLRAYIRWVDMQRSEGARVVEALVPETDDDAVRVMTVHAAKGLEFPFVVVAGFSGTSAPQRGAQSAAVMFPARGEAVCRLSRRVTSQGYDLVKADEADHAYHEDLRKLYVACTRARDYLAVSLYRSGRNPAAWKDSSDDEILRRMALAELMAHTVAEVASPQPAGEARVPHPLTVAEVVEVDETASDRVAPVLSSELERAGWAAGCPVEALPPLARLAGATAGVAAEDRRYDEARAADRCAPGDDVASGGSGGGGAVAVPSREEWSRRHGELWTLAKRIPVVAASRVADLGGNGILQAGGPPEVVAQDAGGNGDGGAAGRVSTDPGLDKDLPDEDAPVWRRGRYGTALGRAVHAVLQTAKFSATDEALAASAHRQAAAEGVPQLADDAARRARNALNSPTVREAGRSRHWRELYAGAEVSGRFLEGFIDLLYEVPDGSFVVVDYKTYASDERPDLHHKPGYRLQIAAYALMIAESTGRPVSRCVFVFLGPDSVHDVQVDDLPEAIAEVRAALAVGE